MLHEAGKIVNFKNINILEENVYSSGNVTKLENKGELTIQSVSQEVF